MGFREYRFAQGFQFLVKIRFYRIICQEYECNLIFFPNRSAQVYSLPIGKFNIGNYDIRYGLTNLII